MEILEPYKIISSGSHGNSVLIFDRILVDVGVPYSLIKPYIKQIQIITWSHAHSDHFNKQTIKKILFERPGIRVAICQHEYERALECGARNIDILEHGKWYDYGQFHISTFKTYHDIPSNGWRCRSDKYKVFFATDTYTLKGITAKNYDLYMLECNYDADTVWDIIREKEERGEFAHQRGSINSHLSRQQAQKFVLDNAGENYEFVMLHQSKSS